MKTRRLPALLVALASIAAVAALVPGVRPASADRAVGRMSPDFEVIESWNTPPSGFLGLKDLRGRMVVVEWFRVDCPHCQAAVSRLNAIQRGRFASGVRVLGLCRQSSERVAAFVRDFGVQYLVARSTVEALEESEIAGYPVAFVLASDGRVLWSGSPASLSDSTLDRLATDAHAWPALPADLEPAMRALRQDDVVGARKILTPCARSPEACDLDASRASQTMLAWIDAWATRLYDTGAAEAARGEPFEAYLAWDLLARAFPRTPEGARGSQRIAALLADASVRREVAAGKALREARWRVASADDETAAAAFDAIARAHAGTRAAARATAAAARLRRRT